MHYSSEDFAPAIEHFEAAVEEYFTAYEECRVLCEGAFEYDGYNYMEYSADLFQSMTGMWNSDASNFELTTPDSACFSWRRFSLI